MNILTPLNPGYAIDRIDKAGGDEFYFGFFDPEWESEMEGYQGINRMSGWKRANFPISQIPQVISQVHSMGKIAFLTLNAPFYNNAMLRYIENYMEIAKRHKIDGVIVSSPELVCMVKKYGLDVIASTMCGIYNVDLADFYINLGVKRIILPRELSLNEIEMITKSFPGIAFEVFLMRNGCVFSDSNCLTVHNPSCGAFCSRLRREVHHIYSDSNEFMHRHNVELTEEVYRTEFMRSSCGICAIYRLLHMGIKAVKIVGRADDATHLEADIELVKKNIEIAENSLCEKEYLDKMIFPTGRFRQCRLGLSCYYPEIRF